MNARLVKKDSIDMEIVEKISQKPGIQLKELSGLMGKSLETIRYRVYRLERSGALKLESSDRYLKMYPAN
jgi:DNA-binding Lrp family transcriptional regulator